jgi:hypothetical protein
MRFVTCGALLAALVLTPIAGPARAGLLDPIPVVNGHKLKTIYTVTGVTAGTGGLETVFFCTSVDKKEVLVAIQIFDYDNALLNDVTTADNGVDTIEPGESSSMETNSVAAIDEDVTITPTDDANHGSARILASSSKIICSAHLISATGTPPTSMTTLPVFKKTKQKGN